MHTHRKWALERGMDREYLCIYMEYSIVIVVSLWSPFVEILQSIFCYFHCEIYWCCCCCRFPYSVCCVFCSVFFLHRLLRAVRIYNSVWFTLLHSHKLVILYASLSLCRSHSVRFPFQRYQLAHWAFTFTSIDSNFDKCELDSESTLIIPAT